MTFLNIKELIMFAADICILFITVYTFYLTVISNKIRFISINKSLSNTYGDSISIVIENKTLSPIVIENINLIIENKYKIQLKKIDQPIILAAFTAQRITSGGYSYTEPDLPTFVDLKLALEVKTSKKKLYIGLHKGNQRVSRKMKDISHNVTKVKNTYNDKIVPKNAKFALTISEKDLNKTVFIFKTGFISGEILGFNGLPKEAVKDKKNLICFLGNWLPKEMNYFVHELDCYFSETEN